MNPTQAQLDARLNPTPATISTPTAGLFRGVGNNGDSIFGTDPTTGKLVTYDLSSLNNTGSTYGDRYGVMLGNLKSQYGIDYNSLPQVNMGDYIQQLGKSGIGSNNADGALQGYSISGDLNTLRQPQTFASLQQSTINGAPLSAEQQAGVRAGTGYTTPEPPAITNIGNPIAPPTTGSTPAPTLPAPQAGNTMETYTASLTGQIEGLKTQIQMEADKRAAEYDVKIKALEQEQADMQDAQDAGLAGIDEATKKVVADKQAALELEKQRFDENYNANQALIGEMDALLTTGNQLVEEMRGTTGLASIMNPRIAKTMSDVAARTGVIQAVLSARNGQMSYAQQQLGTTYDALTSMHTDQINYYKTVMDFSSKQEKEAKDEISTLTSEQKVFLDVKVKMLEADLNRLQKTRDTLQDAMMDPETANTYAMAGVTMNDSVEQIQYKLAQYGYSKELSDKSNKMVEQGYSSTPIAGVQPVYVTDSRGGTKAWYKAGVGTTNKLTEVSPGASLYDPVTGKQVYTAPTAAQQNTTGGYTQAEIDQLNANYEKMKALGITVTKTWPDSPTGGTSTGTPLGGGAPVTVTKADVNLMIEALKTGKVNGQPIGNAMGGDGFVDPAVYVALKNEWVRQGGTAPSFYSQFPTAKYINPANTWVWGQLGIANPNIKKTPATGDRTP